MANTRGIRAGRAFVELGVNDRLTRGLRRAQRQLRAFGQSVRGIGTRLAAVSGAVAAMIETAAGKGMAGSSLGPRRMDHAIRCTVRPGAIGSRLEEQPPYPKSANRSHGP